MWHTKAICQFGSHLLEAICWGHIQHPCWKGQYSEPFLLSYCPCHWMMIKREKSIVLAHIAVYWQVYHSYTGLHEREMASVWQRLNVWWGLLSGLDKCLMPVNKCEQAAVNIHARHNNNSVIGAFSSSKSSQRGQSLTWSIEEEKSNHFLDLNNTVNATISHGVEKHTGKIT